MTRNKVIISCAATPEEAREILSLKGGDKVAF